MASRWAELLKRQAPERGEKKRVTVIYPYYEQPDFLEVQRGSWMDWDAYLCVILVDDGSSRYPLRPSPSDFARVFRIGVDVPWNWLAARNIGAHHANTDWIVLTDLDHVIPPETAHQIVYRNHDPRYVYAFSRREHTGQPIAPHSASFLLTRELFWRIGGYDEALSGHYGTDGEFRRRVQRHAEIVVLPDVLVRYEFVGDSSTTQYRRKLPSDAAAVKRLVAARRPGWTPRTLSFPYEEVTC